MCLNVRRLELAGSQSKVCHPHECPDLREGTSGFTSHLGCFSMKEERGQITFEILTLTFTKKTIRHFSIIYRAEGRGHTGEIALNYSSL